MILSYISLISLFFCYQSSVPFYFSPLLSAFLFFFIKFSLSFFSIDLSFGDSIFRNEEGKNNCYVLGCLIFETGPLEIDKIREVFEARFKISPHYLKLRKILKSCLMVDYWTFSKNFQLNQHLKHILEIKSENSLYEFLSNLLSEKISPSDKPDWEIFLIERYRGEKSGIIFKIHHSYGDGLSLMNFGLNLGDSKNVKFITLPKINRLLLPFLFPFGLIKSLIWSYELIFKKKPEKNGFTDKKIIGKKKVFCSKGLDFKACKQFSIIKGVSINDVLLSLVARTMQNQHKIQFSKPLEKMTFLIPISLRTIPQDLYPIPLENQSNFTLMEDIPKLNVPFLQYLEEIRKSTKKLLKSSWEFYFRGMASKFSYAAFPTNFNDLIINKLIQSISCTFSNVPGPLEPIIFLGKETENIFFFVGGIRNVGIVCNVLTYNQKIYFGCQVDEGTELEVQNIVKDFEIKFNEEIEMRINSNSL